MNIINFLIALVPLAVLVGLLGLNRYPGERLIEKLRTLISHRTSSAHGPEAAGGRFASYLKPVRGGQLIARSMAGRAPPASI